MLKKIIVALFCLSLSFSVLSQKVDIDKLKFSIPRIQLPTNPLPDSVVFFTANISAASSIKEFVNVDDYKSRVRISGFKQVENKPKVVMVDIRVNDILITKNEITSRREENKDKDGKVTSSKTYYKVNIVYDLRGSYSARSHDGKDIVRNVNLGNGYNNYNSSEYGSYGEAVNFWRDNSTSLKSKFVNDAVSSFIGTASNYLSETIGFMEVRYNDHLWTMDSKKHPENENFQKYCNLAISVFKTITSTSIPEDAEAKLKPAMDYFGEIAKRKFDGKNEEKVAYASIYNLAMMHGALDQILEANTVAERLIKEEIDKKDGKAIIEYNDGLLTAFKSNRKVTTHHKRELPDVADIAVSPSSGPSLAAPTPKVEAPKFLQGMVITDEDKEIEGYFINDFVGKPWEVQDGVRFVANELFKDGKYDRKAVEKYSPKELKALAIGKNLYIRATYADLSQLGNGLGALSATNKKYLIEVIKDGKYKLLNFVSPPPSVTTFSGGMPKDVEPAIENNFLILPPDEDKAKKITTSLIESILENNKAMNARYLKGEFSKNGKPVNTKRTVLEKLDMKTSLDDNIDILKIMEELNK